MERLWQRHRKYSCSLSSVIEYIRGLTGGSRLILFCPSGKPYGVGAVAEMADGFMGVFSYMVWCICSGDSLNSRRICRICLDVP